MLLLRWKLISNLTGSVGMRCWPVPRVPDLQLCQHVALGTLAQKGVFSVAQGSGQADGWHRGHPSRGRAVQRCPGETPRFPPTPQLQFSAIALNCTELLTQQKSLKRLLRAVRLLEIATLDLHLPAHLQDSPNSVIFCLSYGIADCTIHRLRLLLVLLAHSSFHLR